MRLKRLEFVVIGVTLAFACFMGGFFAGRNWSAVNIVSVAPQIVDDHKTDIISNVPGTTQQDHTGVTVPADSGAGETQKDPGARETTVPPEAVGQPKSGDGKININLATQSELTDLPGIGNVLASRIVDYRRQHGDFQKIEDIRNVSGIGEKRFETIQNKITVG